MLLKCPKSGLRVDFEVVSLTGKSVYEKGFLPAALKDFIEYIPGQKPEPVVDWNQVTLDNYEQLVGSSYRIPKEHSDAGLTRERSFLIFLKEKGVERKLPEVTLETFKEVMGYRFRSTKQDIKDGLSRPEAFERWKHRNGYK